MDALAVVLDTPKSLDLRALEVVDPDADDVVVDVSWSGISTGTERLLWTGRMPPFPGLGYPLVPGYEAAGHIVDAGQGVRHRIGEAVFVPGANCFKDARGLFGAAASRIVTRSSRAVRVGEDLGERAVLLALAATACHALTSPGAQLPELIVGHGILGRLIARMTVAIGGAPPTVWERQEHRISGATGYAVLDPAEDPRRDYRSIYDASGTPDVLDLLIGRAAKGAEIVLAGFYDERLSFDFVPAFMREARIRIAAEWQPQDLAAVAKLVERGDLSLDSLVTHYADASEAKDAYPTAFEDSRCLKMVLDWRTAA